MRNLYKPWRYTLNFRVQEKVSDGFIQYKGKANLLDDIALLDR